MGKIVFWHWWVLALVLIILEAFVPGTYFLWMGVSASVTGLVLWVLPGLGWEYQVVIFAVFSVVSITLWLMRLKKHPTKTEISNLSKRTAQVMGRVAFVDQGIVNGLGTINMDDTIWRVLGPDCEPGTKVRVVGAEGTDLRVELVGE